MIACHTTDQLIINIKHFHLENTQIKKKKKGISKKDPTINDLGRFGGFYAPNQNKNH